MDHHCELQNDTCSGMMNLSSLYTGAKSNLSPPTPVVLLLADGCELIERGCPSAIYSCPSSKGADLIELPGTKTTDVEWLFQDFWFLS